jgi:glycosyltransferase involved in cell wall biosynthesis
MDWARICAVVIPCLDEAATIGPLVAAARRQVPTVIVIDDGSMDGTGRLAIEAGAEAVSQGLTGGKGAALRAGLQLAHARGFEWALAVDGDGQHAPEDFATLFDGAERTQASLVVGNRMDNVSAMPGTRRVTNRLMSAILSRLTRHDLPDTQCGLRLIRLEHWAALSFNTAHFEFDSELLIEFLAQGGAVEFVPVRAIYHRRRSRIRPIKDAWRWLRWLWRTRRKFAQIRRLHPA